MLCGQFVLAIACTTAAAAPDKLTADQCKIEATSIGKFLADTPHDRSPLLGRRGFSLAKRADVTADVPMAPVLYASALETTFQGQVAENRAALVKLLRAKRPKQVLLMLEQATPWSKVVEVLEVVRADRLVPVIVFETELAVSAPPRSAYDEGIAASSVYPPKPGQKSGQAVRDAVIDPCPTLGKLWREMRGEGVDRTQTAVAGITKALIGCTCSTDLASVRSLFWDLIVVRNKATAIVFDKPPTETLALPAATTWAEASKQVAPGKSYTFAIKP